MAVAPMVTPAALPTTIAFQCRFTRTVNHRLAAAIPPLIYTYFSHLSDQRLGAPIRILMIARVCQYARVCQIIEVRGGVFDAWYPHCA